MSKKETESGKKLEMMIRYLRKVLKTEGLYRPEMSQQVELTASTLLVFRKIRDAALDELEKATIKETSREGDTRIKNNPIFFLYKEMADLLRRDLRALNMNKELTKGKTDKINDEEEDALTLLMRQQSEDD
jgi:hypothetical protein